MRPTTRAELPYADPGSYVIDTETGNVVESFLASEWRDHADLARGRSLAEQARSGRAYYVSEVLDMADPAGSC